MGKSKTLIIATPRSGSTVLAQYFFKVHKCVRHLEPWNPKLNQGYEFPFILENNCVVKTIVDQVPFNFKSNDPVEFYHELIKMFDLVIFLCRKDKEAVIRSVAYQLKLEEKDLELGKERNWHRPYYLEDLTDLNVELPTNRWHKSFTVRQLIDNIYNIFDNVSNSLGAKVTWYEDLYSGDKAKVDHIIKDWGPSHTYNKIIKHIHPSNRYFKTNRTTI